MESPVPKVSEAAVLEEFEDGQQSAGQDACASVDDIIRITRRYHSDQPPPIMIAAAILLARVKEHKFRCNPNFLEELERVDRHLSHILLDGAPQ